MTNGVAGLVGGAGLSPGANVGASCAVFEQGCRHAGLDIAGKGVANPTGILLSSVGMLRYMKLPIFADRLERAIFSTLQSGTKTADIGGSSSTAAFMDQVVKTIETEKASKNAAKKSKGTSKAV